MLESQWTVREHGPSSETTPSIAKAHYVRASTPAVACHYLDHSVLRQHQRLDTLLCFTGDGTIDYEEFLAATINMGKMNREDHLKRAFEEFDLDGEQESIQNHKPYP